MEKRDDSLDAKERALRRIVRECGRALVAYSGGVDSALLARIARDEAADALAVTADSVLLGEDERTQADGLAASIGIRRRSVAFDPFVLAAVRANDPDRCYHCKKAMFKKLLEIAAAEGFDAVLDGGNLSDLDDYRPGRRALAELGIRSPLTEAGLDKSDVRALSRRLGIAGWNRPAVACLASRIPHGTGLDTADLRRVDAAERLVRGFGFRTVRVRLFGDFACIELGQDDLADLPRLASARRAMVDGMGELGFSRVLLDLAGYRTGSLSPSPPAAGADA